MCGIAGIVNVRGTQPIREWELRQMLGAIRHRGPDQFGIYLDANAALGSARLSIVDLNTGQQPIANEDETLWIVFNGEIYNHHELRVELESLGHVFSTDTDTEVILHLYEQFGSGCLEKLNGQFAIAIWNAAERTLFLARDRLGVRPVFYAQAGETLIFASEIKAMLATGRVAAQLDPLALNQIFSFWSALSPRTIFRHVVELPPGHFLTVRNNELSLHKFWELDFPDANKTTESSDDLIGEFRDLLLDAVRIRLRADVPVGAYLSGGLDSSIIAAIMRQQTTTCLDTFSIAFNDEHFDESLHQRAMAAFLGTAHQVVFATHADIGNVFPEVIWHTETPVLRTAPAPMFLLSKLVRERGYKVVLTGEGADELLGGYDIFKEAKIRAFWARQPASKRRPCLLKRLYPDIARLSQNNDSFLTGFFGERLADVSSPDFSHCIRWKNNRRTHRFLADDFRMPAPEPAYPPRFENWGTLERAQFIESTIFLSQYLLSSQGDRMSMAHSVEGRLPFLDHRLVQFCSRLPSNVKLRGLVEKFLLKKLARAYLPKEIALRRKRPYRAPIHKSFFNEQTPDYVRELLSPESIEESGFFKPIAVTQLVRKIEGGLPIGETDDMALAGVLSTQLWHDKFVKHFKVPAPISDRDDIKICCFL